MPASVGTTARMGFQGTVNTGQQAQSSALLSLLVTLSHTHHMMMELSYYASLGRVGFPRVGESLDQSELKKGETFLDGPVAILNILTCRTVYGKESNHFWCRDILQLIIFIITKITIMHIF